MPKEVDKIHSAIVREHPDMEESSAWAIAWSAYKKHSKNKQREPEPENTKATRAAKRAFKNYVR